MLFIANTTDRLDNYLTLQLSQSRNQIQQLIKNSYIKINQNTITKPSHKITNGDNIEVTLPTPKPIEKIDFDESRFDIKIVYEDDDILVINKPPFLVIHGGPSVKEPTLVDWLKYKNISLSTIAGEIRHGIVHRLDKQTSGLMVVAKNNNSHQSLSKQLAEKNMGRYYLAIIQNPLKQSLTIEQPIARNPKNRLKMTVINNGKNAKTSFNPIANSLHNNYQLISCKLYTGRTHQIRVHLAYINRAILGDENYGYNNNNIPRMFLQSHILYLIHPRNGKKLLFSVDVANDMNDFLKEKFDYEFIQKNWTQESIINSFK